jgi:inhibitor of KinA
MDPRVEPMGDAALLVTLGDTIDPTVNERVHRLAGAVRRLRWADPRFGAPTPAYASLLVPYDPIALPLDEALGAMAALLGGSAADARAGAGAAVATGTGPATPGDRGSGAHGDARPGEHIEIPVRYGGADGPDLASVAEQAGLSPEAVVEIHAETRYRCYMLGFSPGFAYLGPLDPRIATPRLPTPRSRVPAGSVGIAARQTGIYPVDSPGGWQIIGRTDVRTWDPARDPPALLRPGMTVAFVPVG